MHGVFKAFHRAGLLHRTLAESLGTAGHLIGARSNLLGALHNFRHGVVHLAVDVLHRGLDGHKVAHIILGGVGCQTAVGHSLKNNGNLRNVAAQAGNGPLKNTGKVAYLIVGMQIDGHASPALNPHVTLFHGLRNPRYLGHGFGNGPAQVRGHSQNRHHNQHNSHNNRTQYGNIDIAERLRGGDAGEYRPRNLSVSPPDRLIGGYVLGAAQRHLTDKMLSPLENSGFDFVLHLGPHSALTVIGHGAVYLGIPVEDSEFTAHFIFQPGNQLAHLHGGIGAHRILQHVGGGQAFGPELAAHLRMEHRHTYCVDDKNVNCQHPCHHVADLLPNASYLLILRLGWTF